MTKEYALLPAALLPWYRENARDLPWRRDREPYHVWVSEIMLQQTRVEAVRGYYNRFLEALPALQDLANASEDQLFKLWEGLGYYSRARNLQKTAKLLCETAGGHFPQDYNSLRSLPGIGPYTAGAIASICFEQPCPAVDGNVLRVAARVTNDPSPVDLPAVKSAVTNALAAVYPAGACGAFTQALMELGATVCTPRSPACLSCPASAFCRAYAAGTSAKLPVRLPKKEKRVEQKTVLLLLHDGTLALEKREQPGLLSGLWQLPCVDGALEAQAALLAAQQLGAAPRELLWEQHRDHIFTHIRWEMICYALRCAAAPESFTWVTPEEARAAYALPTAFRQFLAFYNKEHQDHAI